MTEMVMVERDHHQYKNHSAKRSGKMSDRHYQHRSTPLEQRSGMHMTNFEMSRHTPAVKPNAILTTNFLAASLADLRMTLESRVRCGLVKHHIHVIHDSPGDQVAAMEVRWVVRVLVRHPFRRGNNALPPSSRRRRRAGRFCPTP